MTEEILNLKKLNAAYIAALEYDYCPDADNTEMIAENFSTGLTRGDLKKALDENQGRRPDEIAGDMSEIIKTLGQELRF